LIQFLGHLRIWSFEGSICGDPPRDCGGCLPLPPMIAPKFAALCFCFIAAIRAHSVIVAEPLPEPTSLLEPSSSDHATTTVLLWSGAGHVGAGATELHAETAPFMESNDVTKEIFRVDRSLTFFSVRGMTFYHEEENGMHFYWMELRI